MQKIQNISGIQPLLNATQVAKILGISKSFAYKLMQAGEIPTVQIHSGKRVRQEDLENYILSNIQSNSFP